MSLSHVRSSAVRQPHTLHAVCLRLTRALAGDLSARGVQRFCHGRDDCIPACMVGARISFCVLCLGDMTNDRLPPPTHSQPCVAPPSLPYDAFHQHCCLEALEPSVGRCRTVRCENAHVFKWGLLTHQRGQKSLPEQVQGSSLLQPSEARGGSDTLPRDIDHMICLKVEKRQWACRCFQQTQGCERLAHEEPKSISELIEKHIGFARLQSKLC